MAVTTRAARRETALVVTLLLTAAALINLAADRHPGRLDLTGDQRHTLHPYTRQLAGALTAPLEIHAFLPLSASAPYGPVARATVDLLDDLRQAAPLGARTRVYDTADPAASPDDREAVARQAEDFGVASAELGLTRGDQRTRARVPYGVALLARSGQSVMRPVEHPDALELELARALRALVSPSPRRIIGVTQGHGEPPLLDTPLAAALTDAGEVRLVDLDAAAAPTGLDLLLIIGPRTAYGERARYQVDQHLMRGGALIALLDLHQQTPALPDVLVPARSGIEPLLAAHGLSIDLEHTVLDRTRASTTTVTTLAGGRPVRVHHPLFVLADALDPEHPVTRGLGALPVPLSAPIGLRDPPPGGEVVPIIRTAPTSSARRAIRSLDPSTLAEPPAGAGADRERAGPFTVGAALRGPLRSAFTDGEILPPPPVEAFPGAPPGAPPAEPPAHLDRVASGEARIVLVTSGIRLLSAHPNAALLLQNAVDWSLSAIELVDLRTRRAAPPPLRPTTATERALVKVLTPAAPLVALTLLIALRRARRRARN